VKFSAEGFAPESAVLFEGTLAEFVATAARFASNVDTTARDTERDAAYRALWNSGNKIAAIKLCREQMGKGLKDAKDYCEAKFGGTVTI
jgi:ribosomal protein L7/L12